ncbi:C40 family peptidase [Vogesella sp. LIG4]|uniref:C40 family peptidase n=1 Tax=Vogesella sp. LIG4 TaxID=1192162 RepID=UPI00081FA231|nr:C40 family peptidase [Vogesella sp. LIG4]SCK22712.1 Cell wall-associated hydrolase, NlpC family [Vogesella sp. LIG4]
MKFLQYLLACVLAGCVTLAQAAPDKTTDTKPADDAAADPIAHFSSPGEEAVGDLLLQAMSLLGVAYRFGGSSPESGLDCSGFIQYVFKKSLHVTLPRTAAEMARVGREVPQAELKPGDLVFFNTRGFRYSHVGIYLGNNKFIHSPRTGKNIEVANITQSYWVSHYNGARRVARGVGVAPEANSSAATDSADNTPVAGKKGKKHAGKDKAAGKKAHGKAAKAAGGKKKKLKKKV